jgi:hypothetical protein
MNMPTLYPVLHPKPDKRGEQRIYIRIFYDGKKIEAPTPVKVMADEWRSGEVVNHKEKKRYNDIIREERMKFESLVHEAYKRDLPAEETTAIVKRGSMAQAKETMPLLVRVHL